MLEWQKPAGSGRKWSQWIVDSRDSRQKEKAPSPFNLFLVLPMLITHPEQLKPSIHAAVPTVPSVPSKKYNEWEIFMA